jgi:MSHA biogenesis protein MshP
MRLDQEKPPLAVKPCTDGREGGFAIITAIFLLVILGGLAAFMVTVSTAMHTTSALDLQGARAYQAARAGIEWGAFQVLAPVPSCAANTTLPALGGNLAGFTTTVACIPAVHTEGAATVTTYQLTATATFGATGSADYVERQLQANFAI